MAKILITGAAGNVGLEVIRAFGDYTPDLSQLRAGVWDMESEIGKIRAAGGAEVECVRFDFTDPATYSAFDGVRAVFLLRPPQLSNIARDIEPALDAAKAAGVEHVVFVSLVGVEERPYVPHYKVEAAVKARGFDWTFLRCSFFMQNLNTTHREEIKTQGEIALPVGRAKTSFIDVRDIGAVAARVLTEPGHRNTAYTLTGGEALDYDEAAAILTGVLGRPIRYTNPHPVSFFARQLNDGKPVSYAVVVTLLYTMTRAGGADVISADAERLLERPPITFRQYVEDYRAAWV